MSTRFTYEPTRPTTLHLHLPTSSYVVWCIPAATCRKQASTCLYKSSSRNFILTNTHLQVVLQATSTDADVI